LIKLFFLKEKFGYPADRVKEEYQLWCEEVKRFIDDLEKA